MPLYKYVIEERNGEQEYSHDIYIVAPNLEEAEKFALRDLKDWYYGAEPSDYFPGGYEIESGAIIWELGAIDEVSKIRVFDIEKNETVYASLVLPVTPGSVVQLPVPWVIEPALPVDDGFTPDVQGYLEDTGLPDPMVQEYLKAGGTRCPKCKSDDVDGGFVDVDSGGAWQHIVCNNCGAEWNDIYKLVDVEVLNG